MEEQSEILEYYCTNCGTRVNREDTKCPSCGAELEETVDETDDPDSTIILKTYTNDVGAEMAKSLLMAEGIECFLKGGNTLGTAFSQSSIKLVVLKRDMKRALELLDS